MLTLRPVDESDLIESAKAASIEQLVVGAIVLQEGNAGKEILLLSRADDDFMGGIEEFPSGKLEPGESLMDALNRELEEETRLTVGSVLGYIFHFDYISGTGRRSRQLNFVVQASGNSVVTDHLEHSGYRWCPMQNVAKSRVTSNVLALLKQAVL